MSENPPRTGPADQPRRGTTGPVTGTGPTAGHDRTGTGRPDRAASAGPAAPSDTSAGSAGSADDRNRRGKRGSAGPAEPRSGSDWGTFRAVVIGVGVILAAVGAYFLITGTHGLPDASPGPFDPTLESQFRFFAAVQVGVGAAFIAIAVKFRWVEVLWLVCMMVFFGGVGRVISWAIVGGTPHWLMIVLMIVELAFPAALLVWHRWITKTVELKRSLTPGR